MLKQNRGFSRTLFNVREALGVAGVLALVLLMHRQAACDEHTGGVQATLRVDNLPIDASNQHADTTTYERYRKTQAALIKSRLVLSGAMKEEGIAEIPLLRDQESPLRWLEDHIEVVAPIGSEILWVKLDESSADAVKIVNAVVDSYRKNVIDIERTQSLQAHDLLESKLRETQNDLQSKRMQLAKAVATTAQISGDRELAHERYANLYHLLTSVREKKLDLDLQTAAAKVRLSNAAGPAVPDAEKAKLDIAIADAQQDVLKKTREELSAELDQAAGQVGISGNPPPDVAQLKTDIAQLDDLVAKLKSQLAQSDLQLHQPSRVTVLERASIPQ